MKYIRRLIITPLVCIVAFLILQPFHPASRIKSLTGSDVVGWGRHSEIQTKVYEAQVKYKTKKNLSCADSFGGVDALIKKANTASRLTPLAEKCLEQIIKGPSSPRDDIPKMIRGIKDAFVKPEPKATSKTVFDGSISPQLGGAPIISVEAGQEYTVTISGRRHQYVIDPQNNKEQITTVLADGRMPYNGNRVWIDPDPLFKRQLIDGNQPSLMAVFLLDGQKLFAHNGTVKFLAKNNSQLKLTANCQQESLFFNKSRGSWHVNVKRSI